MVERLRHAGINVDVDPETYPNGRFASLHDPEGNPVQLWQAADPSNG
jgi:glyoxylase I family protein